MLDFVNFLFQQFGNFILFLDSFEIVENLSLLRIIIIIFLLDVVFKFLFPHKGGDSDEKN